MAKVVSYGNGWSKIGNVVSYIKLMREVNAQHYTLYHVRRHQLCTIADVQWMMVVSIFFLTWECTYHLE